MVAPWAFRPVEEASLFNPAIGALLLAKAAAGHYKQVGQGLAYPLIFLVLPAVLHSETRAALPATTRAVMHNWTSEHASILAAYEFHLARAVEDAPLDASSLVKNVTGDALKRLLSQILAISENEHRPAEGSTRQPLAASARHAILFCLQAQDEIASRRFLVHRQGEPFLPQAIKDTLPYFLGAVDDDRLRRQLMLDDARRRLARLERRLAQATSADDEDFSRARALLDEAKRVGLADRASQPVSRAEALAMLQAAAARVDADADLLVDEPTDDLANLQEERRQLRMQLASLKDEMREAELLLSGASGFEREAGEQHARLSAISLVERDSQSPVCPVCDSTVEQPPPAVEEIRQLLEDIAGQLITVRRENPRVQKRLAQLEDRRAGVEERLRENQRIATARIEESERLRAQHDVFVRRARVSGRLALYLETASTALGGDGLSEEIARLSAEVEELDRGLDPEMVEERVTTALNVVGQYMTEYANNL
jgi:hypothetical protein